MQSSPRPAIKVLLQSIGFISLGLGFAGAFLPLLPTTPFILLSAWCFAKSSPRWHAYLENHSEFGPLMSNWKKNRSVSKKHKLMAGTMILISITGILLSDRVWVLKVGVSIGLTVILIALLLVKTARPSE